MHAYSRTRECELGIGDLWLMLLLLCVVCAFSFAFCKPDSVLQEAAKRLLKCREFIKKE